MDYWGSKDKKKRMMMSSPKISIVIPVYNTEKYLKKCLDSLVKQSFNDFEIIIINDG